MRDLHAFPYSVRSPGARRSGAFIAAVGADSEDKQELEADLVASATLVADVVEQCAAIGELHHSIEAGLRSCEDPPASLGEVVAGRRPGRTRDSEIVIFDSTGTALQDVAAAAMAWERQRGWSGAVGRARRISR